MRAKGVRWLSYDKFKNSPFWKQNDCMVLKLTVYITTIIFFSYHNHALIKLWYLKPSTLAYISLKIAVSNSVMIDNRRHLSLWRHTWVAGTYFDMYGRGDLYYGTIRCMGFCDVIRGMLVLFFVYMEEMTLDVYAMAPFRCIMGVSFSSSQEW